MISYLLRTDGNQTQLERTERAVPEPGPGQLLVRLHAAGLNRGEFITGGLQAKAGESKPSGMEGAGEVVALGAGVGGWQPGQRVMGRCAGAYAEYALLDTREAMTVPSSLSFNEAAAVPLTFLVVYDMLVTQGRLRADEWLLIAGVSSGVGVSALQAAKSMGAKVIGTSGSADKLERLKAQGLDLGLCTRQGDFSAAVTEATGGAGVNLAVNAVGGTMFADCVRALAFEGRMATVGYVDHTMKAEIDIQALHAKRLTLFGVSNKLRSAEQRASGVPGFVADWLPTFADGRIRPLVDRVFPLSELPAARAFMEANQHLGKIVVTMAP